MKPVRTFLNQILKLHMKKTRPFSNQNQITSARASIKSVKSFSIPLELIFSFKTKNFREEALFLGTNACRNWRNCRPFNWHVSIVANWNSIVHWYGNHEKTDTTNPIHWHWNIETTYSFCNIRNPCQFSLLISNELEGIN